ncbi:putative late blight resistance protein R1B-17 [Salvia divinorum]|uniref:Late blight resistance protein R1B-17 n=1 Tax=Salvia divinorum TaxID=28513 RepID=A0ABD1IBM8_SALDI
MAAEAESVTFLLETLKEQWRSYKNLKAGAHHEFRQLKSALADLQEFLKQTAMVPEQEQSGYFSENEIRDAVYEVEDSIEFWLTKMDVAKNKGWFNRIKDIFSTEMEQEIKLLRQQIQPKVDLIKQKNFEIKQNIIRPSTSLQVQIPVEVNMVHEEKHGVGADDSCEVQVQGIIETDQSSGQPSWEQPDMEKNIVNFPDEGIIINKLMDPKDRLDVISITGMPGIGKTTFARKIYEHKVVVNKFKFRFWIHVSENFNRMEALRYILKEVTVKAMVLNNERDLIRAVNVSLKNKDFLLVMDNVWRIEDWEIIKVILPNDKGTVLLTTRDTDVAKGANIYRMPHYLHGLSQRASFELLILQVFDIVGDCDTELKEVGNDIATRCRGVPLIILVIGGILKRIFAKTQGVLAVKKEWTKVSTTVNEFLEKDDKKLISRALEISYKKLGHDQRACFLYSGLFPVNHEIPVSTLTQLWIAEGFIKWKEEDNESLEEKAYNILIILINMNLLMATKRNLDQVKTCWAHDMVREFCRRKAMEEKLFRVIHRSIGGPDPPFAKAPEFRRLCFDSDPTDFLTKCPKDPTAKHVRSFLCFYKESVKLQSVTFPDVCNYLRVLNCRSTILPSFPEVKKLILLKHITLFIENLKVLPEDISQLVNLQTLIVETKLETITIKANISKMIRMRCLKTKAAIFLDDKKWKVKACHNLQTFSRLSPKSCTRLLSKRAPNLKTLGVRGKLTSIVEATFLKYFNHLENLKLNNVRDDQSIPSSPLFLSELVRFLPQTLKSLTLANTGTDLKWDVHMRLLAGMENLTVLKLKGNALTGEEWIADETGDVFPSLEFLLVEKSGLVKWTASESNFPTLRSLVIKSCQELSIIPESPSEQLESLEIDLVNKSVVESAKRIEEIQTKRHQNRKREIPFKLTIGPGCDLDLISETINPKDDEL